MSDYFGLFGCSTENTSQQTCTSVLSNESQPDKPINSISPQIAPFLPSNVHAPLMYQSQPNVNNYAVPYHLNTMNHQPVLHNNLNRVALPLPPSFAHFNQLNQIHQTHSFNHFNQNNSQWIRNVPSASFHFNQNVTPQLVSQANLAANSSNHLLPKIDNLNSCQSDNNVLPSNETQTNIALLSSACSVANSNLTVENSKKEQEAVVPETEVDLDDDFEDTRLAVTDKLKASDVCVCCESKEIKYRCPSCLLRTCCLACTKQHKLKYRCTGLHHTVAFKRLAQFDDQQLRNDFHFLEQCGRNIDGFKRQKRQIVQSLTELPNWLKRLRHEAYVRGVHLKLLPAGFTKRKQNRSAYMYATKEIWWDVEFVFRDVYRPKNQSTQSTSIENDQIKKRGIRILNHRVSEKTLLIDLINRYLRPQDLICNLQLNRLLKLYHETNFERINVLMRIGKEKYLQVDCEQTIAKVLKGKSFVEYPTFVIILSEHLNQYSLISETELQAQHCKRRARFQVEESEPNEQVDCKDKPKEDELDIRKSATDEAGADQHEPEVKEKTKKTDFEKEDEVEKKNELKEPLVSSSIVQYSEEDSEYSEGEIQDESEDEENDGPPLEVPTLSSNANLT